MSRFHEKPLNPSSDERVFIVPPDALQRGAEALWDIVHPQLHPEQGLRNHPVSTHALYRAKVQHIMNVAFRNAALVPVTWIHQVRDEIATLRAALRFNGIDPDKIARTAGPDVTVVTVPPTPIQPSEQQGSVYDDQNVYESLWSPLGLNNTVYV